MLRFLVYATFVISFLGNPDNLGPVIGYTKHPVKVIQESISRKKVTKPKHIKFGRL